MKTPWIQIEAESFERGYADGLAGYSGYPPSDVDGYSWAAGLVEGKAERQRNLAQREVALNHQILE